MASHFAAIANVTAEKDQKESASLSVPMEMSNDSPVAAMKCIPSTNTVESLRMLRYILEDIIAVQVKLESLLLPVWKGPTQTLRRIVQFMSKPHLFLYFISAVVTSFKCMLLYTLCKDSSHAQVFQGFDSVRRRNLPRQPVLEVFIGLMACSWQNNIF